MRKFLAAVVGVALMISGCSTGATVENIEVVEVEEAAAPTFDSLGDPELLQYVEDAVYASLSEELGSDDYRIDQVTAAYISEEYLEEVSYNAQENVFFGYRLSEVEEQYEGEKYIFALSETGETEVRPFEAYDDTYDQILKNVAVGSGVILVAVTVSLLAGTVGVPAGTTVSTIFMASAKTGTKFALSSAAIGGAASAIVAGFEAEDSETVLQQAALGASEGFKWGAITGVATGGTSKLLQIRRAAKASIRTPRESEVAALKKYGGTEQKSYLGGKEVPYGTPGSSRADIVRTVDGQIEAIEVKNYDLLNNRDSLTLTLRRQLSERTLNLPEGATQRVVLDVRGRGYSQDFLSQFQGQLVKDLDSVYPGIVIDVMQ